MPLFSGFWVSTYDCAEAIFFFVVPVSVLIVFMFDAEIHSGESGLNTSNKCYCITITPQVFEYVNLFYYFMFYIDLG